MWYFIISTVFGGLIIAITILSLKGRRKRILGNRIPGPEGTFITGYIPLTQGLEETLKIILKDYRM